jgi:hypothetical protein
MFPTKATDVRMKVSFRLSKPHKCYCCTNARKDYLIFEK